MDKQDIKLNIGLNPDQSLADQLTDKLSSNPITNDLNNIPETTTPTVNSVLSSPESSTSSAKPDKQSEHSNELNSDTQQPTQSTTPSSTPSTISHPNNDILFSSSTPLQTTSIPISQSQSQLQSQPFTQPFANNNQQHPNQFFLVADTRVNTDNQKTNDTKRSTNNTKRLRDDLSIKFLFLLVIGLIIAAWITPRYAENIVYSVNRGVERAKAEAARKLLVDIGTPEQRLPWVVKKVTPCVVSIRVYTQSRRGEFMVGVGLGTGVIVDSKDSKSYILTNQHVINKARLLSVQFSDGQITNDVEIIGYDLDTDLAVLRVDLPRSLCIEWGDSQKINVGEQVIAIGNPFGLGNTVTSGIISATERYNPNLNGSRSHEMLQTDAAINPGNSGGPLVNLNGELIGINTTIFSQNGGNQGIGFAIPSMLAKHVYTEIRENGMVEHGWLGIIMTSTTEDFAQSMGWDIPKGVLVRDFTPFSPARDAGIKRGDILIKWGDIEIKDHIHLSHLTVLSSAGKTETIELIRNGEIKKIKVKLGKRPTSIKSI
ncbi:MAG: trypsin-like peptidase domain-containing protein [Planctomycetaceae bacterium]|jgi:serine protease Do|nr:trypsin-like peptidase domain-containing protein [Planctomycetaceae bacterium]